MAELWEALAELWEALGELWEGLYIQKRRHFSEKRPARGRIAPETRTFTKTNAIFQKNDPPEAR